MRGSSRATSTLYLFFQWGRAFRDQVFISSPFNLRIYQVSYFVYGSSITFRHFQRRQRGNHLERRVNVSKWLVPFVHDYFCLVAFFFRTVSHFPRKYSKGFRFVDWILTKGTFTFVLLRVLWCFLFYKRPLPPFSCLRSWGAAT